MPRINCCSESLGPSGTSRVEGATIGTPPLLEINCAISLARRLSNDSTRNPLNPGMTILCDENSREMSGTIASCIHQVSRFQGFVGFKDKDQSSKDRDPEA